MKQSVALSWSPSCPRPLMTWRRGCALLAVLAAAFGLSPTAHADLETQTDCTHSTLVPVSGPAIRDDEFADLLKKILLKNGTNSNVRDAKFLFQQCFGGGML